MGDLVNGTQFLDKGIKYLNLAVDADEQSKYEEALKLYLVSFEYFVSCLKYCKNQKIKGIVRNKLLEFMSRAENIKKSLDEKKKEHQNNKEKDSKDSKKDPETEKLRKSLDDAILKERPNIKWDDVAGLESAKRSLEEAVILPQKFPQMFTGKRKAWRGILLYGPPGTGKTLLAKATASMTNSTFFAISSSDLISKWQGESEKLIRELFRMAMENKPSIIFIDEIDAICGKRTDEENDATRRIKTEFLVQMQKILDSSGVLVLGATNRPFDLDAAVRRRFEKRIYIPLPDSRARRAMIGIHLGSEQGHIEKSFLDSLASKMEGYSGSDISAMVREVLMAPVRAALSATHFKRLPNPSNEGPKMMLAPCEPNEPGAIEMNLFDIQNPDELLLPPIDSKHFEMALKRIKPSVSKAELKEQEKFTEMYGEPGSLQLEEEEENLGSKSDKGNEVNSLPPPKTESGGGTSKEESKEELELMKFVDNTTSKVEDFKKQMREKKKKDGLQPAM